MFVDSRSLGWMLSDLIHHSSVERPPPSAHENPRPYLGWMMSDLITLQSTEKPRPLAHGNHSTKLLKKYKKVWIYTYQNISLLLYITIWLVTFKNDEYIKYV